MGCFSFECKICGKPIRSDSFSGEHCTLFLLEDGQVIERMTGQYNSYGQVFDDSLKSVEWESYPWSGHPTDMGKDFVRGVGKSVCDLMFDKDRGNGIAAVHTDCMPEGMVPTERSEDDPDQGWGEYRHGTEGGHSHEVMKPDGGTSGKGDKKTYRFTWRHEAYITARNDEEAWAEFSTLNMGSLDNERSADGWGCDEHGFVEHVSAECVTDDYRELDHH